MRQSASQIKDVLGSVISRLSGEKKGRIDRLVEAWKHSADKAYSHTRLASFKAKRLVVNVDSPAWMYELNLRKQQLLDALNKQLKGEQVKEIILRIGDIE